MAYQPSLSDLDEGTQGYTPSLSDIPYDISVSANPFFIHPSQSPVDIFNQPIQPLSQAMQESGRALKRGTLDVGQGLKQLYLENFGNPNDAIDYTKKVDQQRKQYENSPEGQRLRNQFFRSVPSNAPMLAFGPSLGAESIIGRLLGGAATGGAISGTQYIPGGEDRLKNTIMGAGEGAGLAFLPEVPQVLSKVSTDVGNYLKNIFTSHAPLEQSLAKATAQHQANIEALNEAKNIAQKETGKTNPAAMQYAKVQATKELSQIPNVSPDLTPDVAQKNLDQAVINHESAKQDLMNVQNKVDSHLNKGAAHDVRAAGQLDELISNKKNEIGGLYNQLEQSLATKNIQIPNTDNNKDLQNDLISLIKQGNTRTPETKEVLDKLNNIGKDQTIPARDYLSTFRTTRDYLRDARKEQYIPGITDEQRMEAKSRADELESKLEEMRPILENGIGSDDSALLKQANSRWSQEIAPLYKNKVYQQINNYGRMPENIVKQLRGTEPGNVVLRNMIKSDPELLRNVVGQRYAVKSDEVHNPNELMQEYTNKMPDLNNLLTQRQDAIDRVNQGAIQRKNAENDLKTSIKNQKVSDENSQQRADLQNKVYLFDKHISNLNAQLSQKNISLAEKIRIENELQKVRDSREKSIKTLGKIGKIGAYSAGIGYAGKRIYDTLSGLLQGNNGD